MDRKHPEYLAQLARVIHTDLTKPKILSCWFSNSDEDADRKFPEYKEHFLSFFQQGSTFVRADKEKFLEQVNNADVIYFHGGHTTLLLPAMEKYENIEKVFEGKIVVGSSAGANYLSSTSFSPSKATAEEGGSLTNLAVIVHFNSIGYGDLTFEPSFWQDAIGKVREKSGNNDVILLPEGTFTIVDV